MAHVVLCHGARMHESCHTRDQRHALPLVQVRCDKYGCVMSHLSTNHGTRMIESWHTYHCVVTHVNCRSLLQKSPTKETIFCIRICHGTCTIVSCHTCKHILFDSCYCVMAHVWMSHGPRVNESCRTYTHTSCNSYCCVMAHVWMSHGTRMDESWSTYE